MESDSLETLLALGALATLLGEGVMYLRPWQTGSRWPDEFTVPKVVAAIVANMVLSAIAVLLGNKGGVVLTPSAAIIVGFAFPRSLDTFFGPMPQLVVDLRPPAVEHAKGTPIADGGTPLAAKSDNGEQVARGTHEHTEIQ